MQKLKWDAEALDYILTQMVETVSETKNEIFAISEKSQTEYRSMFKELENTKQRVAETIDENDRLAEQATYTRTRLAEVNKHFHNFREEEIREAYEQANQTQTALSVNREAEKQLRQKRDDLEQRLTGLHDTVEKAQTLSGQVSVVLNYLNGDLKSIGEIIDNAQQKQDFGLKIIEAQEEERRRLSREIHDGPAQTLAHVLLGSELVEQVQQKKGEKAALEELSNLRGMIKDALYDVRRIIYDLRPMTLDDLGLLPTLEKFLHRIEEQEQVVTTFQQIGESRRLSSKMETALFRLVQEAVENACQHGEAQRIDVRMTFKAYTILMVIEDDGKGFDPAEKQKESFGMIGMQERAELLEGEVTFDSRVGEGTAVMFNIPVHEQGVSDDNEKPGKRHTYRADR